MDENSFEKSSEALMERSVAPPSTQEVTKLYNLYTSGKYKDVIDVFNSSSTFVNDPYSLILLGNCHKNIGNDSDALDFWKKAVKISPVEFSGYLNIANLLFSQGDYSEAILNWHLALAIKPENPTVNYNLAVAYNKVDNRIKATKFYERYLKYESDVNSTEYQKINQSISNLKARVELYSQKSKEYIVNKNIKNLAYVYLKMISTYAILPNIYKNVAEIFQYDKNYEKALEFYLLIYLYFSYSPGVLLEIANLYYKLRQYSYAYAFYKRCIKQLPKGTSFYEKVESQISSLKNVVGDTNYISKHLEAAKLAESQNDYESAINEYEIYLLLSGADDREVVQLIKKYKVFVNPEPYVVNILNNQIDNLMKSKDLQSCVDVCDRIIKLSDQSSQEFLMAIKYKAECKRFIDLRKNNV